MRNKKVYEMVFTALMLALIVIMTFTPFGFIPLGVINATIVHVPVIIGALILGPKWGAVLGAAFGLASMAKATFVGGTLSSFVFSPVLAYGIEGAQGSLKSLVIAMLPRILVGIIPYYLYKLIAKKFPKSVGLFIAGMSGAFTNTILVLGGIYVLFKDSYAVAVKVPADTLFTVLMGIVSINGVAEALVAGVITIAIVQVLVKVKPRDIE